MRAAADTFWEHLSPTGISWIGFYTIEPGADEMLLGPRRDKPACSPIGLHGALSSEACDLWWQGVNGGHADPA